MTDSGKCELCHPSCATCSKGNDANACLSCKLPNKLDTGQKNCYFECPAKKYKTIPIEPLSTTCLDCHSTCETCMGGEVDECTSCPENKPLENLISVNIFTDSGGITTDYPGKGECVPNCSSK